MEESQDRFWGSKKVRLVISPKIEEVDEEIEKEGLKKKMEKVMEVSREWEHLNKNNLLQGGRRPCCAGRHLVSTIPGQGR